MSGHGSRNKKTSVMFTLCISFILFAGAMFSLQSRSLSDNIRVFIGSDISIRASIVDDRLDTKNIGSWLDKEMIKTRNGEANHFVLDYAFISYNLKKLKNIQNIRFSNLPNLPEFNTPVFAVTQRYLSATYNSYYMINEVSKYSNFPKTANGKDDVIAGLYTDAGNARLPEEENGIIIPPNIITGQNSWKNSNARNEKVYKEYIDVIMSEALRQAGSVSTKIPLLLEVTNVFQTKIYYLCKARGMVSKVPGFLFSSFQVTATAMLSPILISMDTYLKIMQDAGIDVYYDGKVPVQRVLIRLKDGVNANQRQDVINALRPFFNSESVFGVDVPLLIERLNSATTLMTFFFTIVGIVAMVLSFFILWLSFTANIRENSWECGVLRAIGITSSEAIMMYVYEALALVISSVLLGTIVGLLIASSLTLQFNLFVEMPFVLDFPYALFFSLFIMAIVIAVLGSLVPAQFFLKNTIAEILKKT